MRYRQHLVRRCSVAIAVVIAAVGALLTPGQAHAEQPGEPVDPMAQALQLVQSDDPFQRQLGFLRLEAMRSPSSAETIRRYLEDRNEDTRAFSVRALAAVQGSAAIPTLLQKLNTDKSPTVRRAVLLGLEPLHSKDPDVFSAMIGALRDRSPEVRMSAVDIVSRINDPRARDAIFERKKRERRRDVQRVLNLAMKRLGNNVQ